MAPMILFYLNDRKEGTAWASFIKDLFLMGGFCLTDPYDWYSAFNRIFEALIFA